MSRFVVGTVLCFNVLFHGRAAVPDLWMVRGAPSTNALHGVAYGNGLFVAVGSGATLLVSWNGADWLARPSGATPPALSAVAFGQGRYVAGGGEGALIRSSTDGIHWTNGLATLGIEHIYGLKYGYGEFVAVGSGPQPGTSYLLTSPNGLDWIAHSVPTTNRLLAVSPAYGADGTGWADFFYVAVGERGTIITSTNGVNWTLRNSGTTAALRSVLWKGGFFVGGDGGTLLTSSGITWPAASPLSFDVRGLAASGLNGVMVAAGSEGATGRLQVSTNGVDWFNLATFSQPLNAITYGAGSFVAVGEGGLIVQSGSSIVGPTNEWTKPTSGYWEEPFWSLGRLPGPEQSLVAFHNVGWRALGVGSNTTFQHAGSLSVENLIVDAPDGATNQLLLNYAGLNIPLSIRFDFTVGRRGSVAGHYSALSGGNAYLSGPATFSDYAKITFGKIVVGATAPAELNLTDSSLSALLLILGQGGSGGTLHQTGGSSQVSSLQLNDHSAYHLRAGTLVADRIDLQTLPGNGLAQFTMQGGSADVQGPIQLGQLRLAYPEGRGEFLLSGGFLQARELNFLNGTFTQTGGTNSAPLIALPLLDRSRCDYVLSGGTLLSGHMTLGKILSPFTPSGVGMLAQSGGVHSNATLELFGEVRRQIVTRFGAYTLSGGLLVSDRITELGGGFTQVDGTNLARELVLDQASSFVLTGGQLITSNTTVDTCCCVESRFLHTGGNHTVGNRLLLRNFVGYRLQGGSLAASNIEIAIGGELLVQGGAISNAGLFTLRQGALRAGGQSLQLGQLQVFGENPLVCVSGIQTGSPTLDVGLGGSDGSTTLHFRDSRDVPWSGSSLQIVFWSGTTNGFGPDHIYVGTNAQGLTEAQLSQVVFVNPIGVPPGSYSARLLPTGELVPDLRPTLHFTRTSGSLILDWTGDYQLSSATNVTGPYLPVPGATPPQMIPLLNPQRFFRLEAIFE